MCAARLSTRASLDGEPIAAVAERGEHTLKGALARQTTGPRCSVNAGAFILITMWAR